MPLSLVALIFMALLAFGYFSYGRYIARFFRLDPKSVTPAVRREDGQDFVPTKPFYLFGQHFSAIAAAGPIAGPILACQQFGWLPCLLWIGVGVIFIGAVHDLAALVASVRHEAATVAEIMHRYLGRRAWIAVLSFIWIALIYVIVAFTDITAHSFVGKVEEMEGLSLRFNPGGAVALASLLYLVLSIALGLMQRYLKWPLWLLTLIFVPATLGAVYAGTLASEWLILPQKSWSYLILVYCGIASLTPVWLLLQPRGYLGGFVLYLALAVGALGLLFGGYDIAQPSFKGFQTEGGTLFPFLFVTIACGACSGFHGLICSGTTSKQIARETHCRPVGYGAMLMEAFVALVALGTIMILPASQALGSPNAVYAQGMGEFLSRFIGHRNFAITFGAMAFSTFVFDTLDVTTRLGRYIVQELWGRANFKTAATGTALTLALPLLLLSLAPTQSWKHFWVLFGASNQLLAALTLLGVALWLKSSRQPRLFILIPMAIVMLITLVALGNPIYGILKSLSQGQTIPALLWANGSVAFCLIALALYLLRQGVAKLANKPASSEAADARELLEI